MAALDAARDRIQSQRSPRSPRMQRLPTALPASPFQFACLMSPLAAAFAAAVKMSIGASGGRRLRLRSASSAYQIDVAGALAAAEQTTLDGRRRP